jgi:multiple sugar transport system permease protein
MIISIIGTLQYNGTLTVASRGGRGENESLYMYAVMIYRKGILGDELGYACALAWLLLAVIGIITVVIFRTSSWVFYGEEQ